MRKILTASMVVGAALLVSACGDNKAANNTAMNEATNDVMVDDTMNMSDDNMMMEGNTAGGDANMMNDMDASTTADNTVATNDM